VQGYHSFLVAITTPGQYLDAIPLYHNLIREGGYFPLPSDATPEDQVYAVGAGAWSLRLLFGQGSQSHNFIMQRLGDLAQQWRAERLKSSTAPSFGQYIREAGAASWL
jgi:hypothetical protein